MMNILRMYRAAVRIARRRLNLYPLECNDALRWGIIGLGNMARVFADALKMSPDAKLVAVASRSKEKAVSFASQYHVRKSYGAYHEMLADESLRLDIVYIATPVKYHFEHIKLCIEAGMNVLCEKPIAYNAWQLEELIKLAKEKGCFLMEGMWLKCLPTFRQTLEWVNSGKIGELQLVRANLFKRELIMPEYKIFNAAEGGGVLRDYGVYAIAFVQAFMGEPEIMSADCRRSIYGLDSDWQVLLKRNGIKAFVSLSSDFASSSKAALVGEEGTIELESQFNRTNIVSLYDKDGKLIEKHSFNYVSEGFEYEILHVRKMIRAGKGQSEYCPLADSLAVLRLIDQFIDANE